jgi:hypothetical protein
MDTQTFWRATPGRVVIGTAGILAGLAGVLAIVGPGPHFNVLAPLALICGYIGFIVAVGLSTQDFWGEAVAMILAMPLVLGLYFAGMYLVVGAGVGFGTALVAAGLVIEASTFVGSFAPRASRQVHATGH